MGSETAQAGVMSYRMVQVILILAPVVLALPIGAYLRLRRHVYQAPEPVVSFRNLRWNSFLIVMGGVLMLRGAAGAFAYGQVAQLFGFILALEFFYVAYVNLWVAMSGQGLLIGMNFSPWRRFADYRWISEQHLELVSRTGRRYRLRVPTEVRPEAEEIVDQNILR